MYHLSSSSWNYTHHHDVWLSNRLLHINACTWCTSYLKNNDVAISISRANNLQHWPWWPSPKINHKREADFFFLKKKKKKKKTVRMYIFCYIWYFGFLQGMNNKFKNDGAWFSWDCLLNLEKAFNQFRSISLCVHKD